MTSDSELERVRRALAETSRTAIANGLDAAKARLAEAKRAHVDALTAVDDTYDPAARRKLHEKAVEAQDQIADAVADLHALRWQKTQLEALPMTQPPPDDRGRFERAVSRLPPQAQDWCRKHPEYVTDERLNAKANAAHHDALAAGVEEYSPEYFARVEGALGLRRQQRRDPAPDAREIEAAKTCFKDEWQKSPQDAVRLYRENKRKLQQEGRL